MLTFRKAQRFLQLLHHLIDNRAGKCPLNHTQGAAHKIWLVQIRISAALGGTVFVDAAKIVFQERTRSHTGSPDLSAVLFRWFHVRRDKLLTMHPEPPRNAIDFLFAKARLHLPAAVGTIGAIDPGPHPPRGLEDALVDFV